MARRTRRTAWFVAVAVLGTIMLGGYTAASARAPLAQPTVTLSHDADAQFTQDGDAAQALVDGQSLPTAVGYTHLPDIWTNSDSPQPLASLSKLVTMLVTLEEHPLDPDTSTWGTHTWTLHDWRLQQEYIADLGVAYPVSVGTEIALRDMFSLIFLPSANDMVSAFAYSVFADNAAFVTAVEDWAERHDLASLEFVEPTGLSEHNIAAPADVLRIGIMALEHPVISQFISQKSAVIPGIGVIENTNPLLSTDEGIIGVKTGRSMSAGFNLIVAQERQVAGRTITQVSVTMGRGSLAEREASGREMLALLDTLPTDVEVVAQGINLGSVTDWQGETYPITTTRSVTATLLPGESIHSDISIDLSEPVMLAGEVGTLTVTTPAGVEQVALHSTYEHAEPSLWWRVTHPSIIYQ